MTKPTLLIAIAVACFGISVLGEKGTRGKSIFPVFRRAAELSFVFYAGLMAMYFESLGLGIAVIAAIVYCAARREWDDLFGKGVTRLVRYVFRRNAPLNRQK